MVSDPMGSEVANAKEIYILIRLAAEVPISALPFGVLTSALLLNYFQ